MWQLFGGWKSNAENNVFALFTKSFKKKCLTCKMPPLHRVYLFFHLICIMYFLCIAHSDDSSFLYTSLCVHIYICILYIYVYVWFAFQPAGGLGRAVSCQLLWFQPLWYDLRSLRGELWDEYPECLFRIEPLISRLNQWSAQKGWEEKGSKRCLFTVQKFSFCLSSPLYVNLCWFEGKPAGESNPHTNTLQEISSQSYNLIERL